MLLYSEMMSTMTWFRRRQPRRPRTSSTIASTGENSASSLKALKGPFANRARAFSPMFAVSAVLALVDISSYTILNL
ncbi:hypothetical protein ATCV1_z213R [Acanthocystis turfacea chlorella virus 1]|uniref:Uncharacterized protein z213R n=1 Tax=Chlorovirus heliozoae TaxID=322019 RepID=A7K8H3_9PHYC|nr:hypothetical protein ATCV1_z213R [Acanthocystis turfacea chlorella virus 1]ABT16347.1 hypothetical protein ATCV1_z213R [Acanthocystis turfacea chlorella virus 1]